jgi:hypothetical protein
MSGEMTNEQAAADLARAEQANERVRSRARWMSAYLGVFAVGFGALTLILGLVTPLWLRMTISSVLWAPLVVGMVWWTRQQPAAPRDWCRRGGWGWAGTGVLYGAALWIGTPGLLGRVEYWVPAAVLVTIPLALAAWREHRA